MSRRLTVIVSEFGAAVNVGGAVETTTRTFDLPDDISEFIEKNKGQWATISFGLEQIAAVQGPQA